MGLRAGHWVVERGQPPGVLPVLQSTEGQRRCRLIWAFACDLVEWHQLLAIPEREVINLTNGLGTTGGTIRSGLAAPRPARHFFLSHVPTLVHNRQCNRGRARHTHAGTQQLGMLAHEIFGLQVTGLTWQARQAHEWALLPMPPLPPPRSSHRMKSRLSHIRWLCPRS